MAAIYEYENGQELTSCLQGSSVCDEAIICAQEFADEQGAPVVLEDDDGVWLIYPVDEDGDREAADELDTDWAG
jgi:hypothetical protein